MIGYEAGYRTQINRNLYLDFTAFYNTYNDLQGYGPIALSEPRSGNSPLAVPFLRPTLCQRHRGPHSRHGNRSQLENHALVAGARLLFVPAYVAEGQAGIHGYWEICSVPTGIEP